LLSANLSRRDLLKLLGAVPLAGVAPGSVHVSQAPPSPGPLKIGLVSRHVQWTRSRTPSIWPGKIGFDAIEWNVRAGGHIEPAQVERDLPRAVELTRKAGLAVDMITTSIQDAKSPHAEPILRAMKGLDIRYYRGGQYFRYDYTRDLTQQLEELKPRVASIAALNDN
jgi:L-ribulose-5-phosphate 3-epimerase